MNEVIAYHNDLNKVRIPNLSEYQQNLLMKILVEVKEKPANTLIYIPVDDLKDLFNDQRKGNFEIFQYLLSLRDNFFKADFKRILDTNGRMKIEFINLFEKFGLVFEEPKSKPQSEWRNFVGVEMKVQEEFLYILNDLTKNFTSFELAEFIGLNGKYAKTLYRLLKQFRSTGKVTIYSRKWDEFIEFMDIPKSYPIGVVDQKVLKPAIKELSAERNLFTNTVPIFENLTYKKIKDPKGRGRGGKVIGIEFYWTPEENRTELSEQIKDLKKLNENLEKDNQKEVETQIETPKIHPITGDTITDLTRYIGAYFYVENKFDKGRDSCKILELHNSKDGIYGLARNQENEKTFELNFKDLKHMKNALKLN